MLCYRAGKADSLSPFWDTLWGLNVFCLIDSRIFHLFYRVSMARLNTITISQIVQIIVTVLLQVSK